MVEVDVALAEVHEKEHDIRVACLDFDLSVSEMRRTLQLPPSKAAWSSAMGTRLNFLNRQYRTNLKNDLQALSTNLRQVYGHNHSTTKVVARLDERVRRSRDALAESEKLMIECQSLYDARVSAQSLSICGRVRLYRGMPSLRQALEEARTFDDKLETNITTWKRYYVLLASETALPDFLDTLRAHKLTIAAAEEMASPVFQRLNELYAVRDSIINESSTLALDYERSWLERGGKGVRERDVRRALRELDAVLEKAEKQKSVQFDAVQEVMKLTTTAFKPSSLPGPDGADISFDCLRASYSHFEIAHGICDAMDNLLDAVTKGLQSHLRDLHHD